LTSFKEKVSNLGFSKIFRINPDNRYSDHIEIFFAVSKYEQEHLITLQNDLLLLPSLLLSSTRSHLLKNFLGELKSNNYIIGAFNTLDFFSCSLNIRFFFFLNNL
jgi:hypothetical protein